MRSRRTRFLLPIAAAGVVGLVVASLPGLAAADRPAADKQGPVASKRTPASSITLQAAFDHIGAEVHELTQDGRTSYYIDEGTGDHPVVFIGGASTSLQAFQLTEFARTTRERLGVRINSVERNGLGA